MLCEYCDKSITECLKHFEASVYSFNPINCIADKKFNYINDAIEWAKTIEKGIHLDIYQGCDRENLIYQQSLINEDN